MPEHNRTYVAFRKQVSDGNYGTEAAEVMLDVFDVSDEAVGELFEKARRLVHAELAKSPAWRVRDAVKPEEVAEPLAPPEDPEDLPY